MTALIDSAIAQGMDLDNLDLVETVAASLDADYPGTILEHVFRCFSIPLGKGAGGGTPVKTSKSVDCQLTVVSNRPMEDQRGKANQVRRSASFGKEGGNIDRATAETPSYNCCCPDRTGSECPNSSTCGTIFPELKTLILTCLK